MSSRAVPAPVPPSAPGGASSVGPRMIAYSWERGHENAIATGALDIREADLPPLCAFAESIVRAAVAATFDPSAHMGDQLRSRTFQRSEIRLKQLDEAVRNAWVSVRDLATRLALAESAVPVRPERPLIVMTMAVAVLAITVAPTLHDFVFYSLNDEILNWFLSVAFAGFVGVMLAWGLFSCGSSAFGSRTAIVAGVLLGVGLAILRFSAATNFAAALFASGLTVMEVGVVVFLGWLAQNHREAIEHWRRARTDADQVASSLASQREEVRRLEGEQKVAETEIANHTNYIEERAELTRDLAPLRQACVEAICNGYRDGVAENQGRVQRF